MKTASISEAKNRLSAYIDMVRRGETVLITDRSRPVAWLVPPGPGTKQQAEGRLAELERLGVIRRGSGLLKKLPKPVKLLRSVDAVRIVSEQRGRY